MLKPMDLVEIRARIARQIETDVFVKAHGVYISNGRGERQETGWLFDFRRVVLQGETIAYLSTLFCQTFQSLPKYQVCGLEVAAIPLVTGITLHRYTHGVPDANGFFIRKSRKKDGLLKMIEGAILPETPIILVDDIMNQGKSFMRQIEVLESLGHKVHAVWSIIRYRDESFYTALAERGIAIHSVFTLDDFSSTLHVKKLVAVEQAPPLRSNPTVLWKFVGKQPNYFWVVPKSTPCIDDQSIFYATDEGILYAMSLLTGEIRWKFKVGMGSKGKTIFSTPICTSTLVVFGSYDGNVYALDKKTGKKVWVSYDGDFVGSSPAFSKEHNCIFIGLEFGIWRKRGGIVALDAQTGEKIWWDNRMPNYTHASPCYIAKHAQVSIGSNDGILRLYDARTGNLLWRAKTGDPSPAELNSGFSEYDIKGASVYVPEIDALIVVNTHGDLFAFARKTGATIWHATMELGAHGSPHTSHGNIYVASLDKHIYCFSMKGALLWKYSLGARSFSTPVTVRNTIVIGSNNGRLVFLHPHTGAEVRTITITERITNKVVYDTDSNTLILSSYANELYALRLPDDDSVDH